MQEWIFNIRSRTFFVLIVAFTAVTVAVYTDATVAIDDAFSSHLEPHVRDTEFDAFVQYVTELGHHLNLLVLSIILCIIRKTRKVGITLLILIVILTVMTGYVKCGVDRDRPDTKGDWPDTLPPRSNDTFAMFCDGGWSASYPSGYAARAMAFATVLGYAISSRFPRGCYLILAWPAVVAASRMYLLYEYPTDIIGGIVAGVLVAGILAKKTRLDHNR